MLKVQCLRIVPTASERLTTTIDCYDVGLTLQFLKTDSTIPVAHFLVCCDSYLGMLC